MRWSLLLACITCVFSASRSEAQLTSKKNQFDVKFEASGLWQGLDAVRAESVSTNPAQYRKSMKPLKFHVFIRGEGDVEVALSDRIQRTWSAKRTTASGLVEDNSHPLLLQGIISRGRLARHSEHGMVYVAASVIDGMFELILSGQDRRSGSALYKVRSRVHSHRARVKRVSRGAGLGPSCGTHAAASPATGTSSKDKSKLARIQSFKKVEVSTEADKELSDRFGATTNARVAAAVNGIDALYRTQLGLTLEIRRQHVYDVPSVLTSTEPSTLLTQFRTNPDNSTNLGARDVSHLFSGKDIDGSVIGIAYIGTVCSSTYAYGLTQYIDAYVSTTFGHELGHNFSAQHSTDLHSIMAPAVNLGDQYFAAESIQSITSFAGTLACLDTVDGTNPTPTATPTATSTRTADPSVTPTSVPTVALPTATPTPLMPLPPPPPPPAATASPTPTATPTSNVNPDVARLTIDTEIQGARAYISGRLFDPSTRSSFVGEEITLVVNDSPLTTGATRRNGTYAFGLRAAPGSTVVVKVVHAESGLESRSRTLRFPRSRSNFSRR